MLSVIHEESQKREAALPGPAGQLTVGYKLSEGRN